MAGTTLHRMSQGGHPSAAKTTAEPVALEAEDAAPSAATASRGLSADPNRIRHADRPVHDWYRFVLSFPPHLVRDCLERLGVRPSETVLDPFCGTGTTLVECRKAGIESVGLERNPMAHFATAVKVDWSVPHGALADFADRVAEDASSVLADQNLDGWRDLPVAGLGAVSRKLETLDLRRARLLLKNSISPVPLHKTLVVLAAMDRATGSDRAGQAIRACGRLAMANALVKGIGNLRFGPEVGVGTIKDDAPVLDLWRAQVRRMEDDLRAVAGVAAGSRAGGSPHADGGGYARARVVHADARDPAGVLSARSVDAVITSPPYPNEKDYTRTTRLESVVLGMITTLQELRALKRGMVRSNTRGVYKADDDDQVVRDHAEVARIADRIERRRIELGKTSGFERTYARVVKLYFGGMSRHLASLRATLRPGARLAYVVGDQASYLRVMIRTGRILAEIAESLGYEVVGIDLFRTRLATATREQLREEVVLLRWPGGGGAGEERP